MITFQNDYAEAILSLHSLAYITSLAQDQETIAQQVSMHCVGEQPVVSFSLEFTRAAFARSTLSFLL